MYAVRVQLASPDADLRMKRKRAQLTGSDNFTHFDMRPAPFSSSVRMLAVTPDQPAELGQLGQGGCGAAL